LAQLENIEAIERRLWSAADTLRANSNYASNEYFLPVMGLIFLRHAYNRFQRVRDEILPTLPSRGGKTRELTKEDFSQKTAIYLRPQAQFDFLVNLTDADDRAQAIIAAMESIEADYESLRGALPKAEYQELSNDVLGRLLRILNPEELKRASGDIFGRIYEYFLTQFADQKAHDGGEFFTPVSLVSLIANVLEPEGGVVLDPACGSGGMFVQSAHFVEKLDANPSERLAFYGLEKNPTTIRLAKMNLAVHGLEGDIQKAITYYEDPHELLGKADFVMTNPPFNVDEVDADRVKRDPRLPFGLPGVNKHGKVSNANYLWISYFYSYLNEHGRAGFVMSSQASSAGRGEAEVRRKLVETGAVDIMIAIRSNFFYTRTVPCELWFIDRGKPDQPSPPAPLPGGEGGGRTVGGAGGQYRGGLEYSGLLARARELRQAQTPAEELLWELVRDRRLLGLTFRRQHQFGNYVLDFYCHEAKVAVELDGPVHEGRTRHDTKRDRYLASQGVTVMRITNQDLLTDTESTLKALIRRLKLPSPPGRGAGGEGRSSASRADRDHVLMIDARNIYRKVTRKIYDFSPEQRQNLLAIVWLYRGQQDRFVNLVTSYLDRALGECSALFVDGEEPAPLARFVESLEALRGAMRPFLDALPAGGPRTEPVHELQEAGATFSTDAESLRSALDAAKARWAGPGVDAARLAEAVETVAPLAESTRDLVKQADPLYRLGTRVIESCENELDARKSDSWPTRDIGRLRKAADEARRLAVEQLKRVRYFHKQARWLVERFPDAELRDVPGLVKLVDPSEIEANDWSLTPGRYVGVSPEEEDDGFDFEEALREIHVELKDLNAEAADLAEKIARNFEELGG